MATDLTLPVDADRVAALEERLHLLQQANMAADRPY